MFQELTHTKHTARPLPQAHKNSHPSAVFKSATDTVKTDTIIEAMEDVQEDLDVQEEALEAEVESLSGSSEDDEAEESSGSKDTLKCIETVLVKYLPDLLQKVNSISKEREELASQVKDEVTKAAMEINVDFNAVTQQLFEEFSAKVDGMAEGINQNLEKYSQRQETCVAKPDANGIARLVDQAVIDLDLEPPTKKQSLQEDGEPSGSFNVFNMRPKVHADGELPGMKRRLQEASKPGLMKPVFKIWPKLPAGVLEKIGNHIPKHTQFRAYMPRETSGWFYWWVFK